MAFTGNYTCDSFKLGLINGSFNFGPDTTDVFKIALYTNSATLTASTSSYTAVGEVSGSGYATGGLVLTPAISYASSVSFVSFNDAVWSGAFTARGALIYKYDNDLNPTVCVLDFGSDKTSTNTFTVQFPPATATGAIIRLS